MPVGETRTNPIPARTDLQQPARGWSQNGMVVRVYSDRGALGTAAASDVAAFVRSRLESRPEVRLVLASAPSQAEFCAGLVAAPGIDWSRVSLFHMDEFIGLPAGAPQRFAEWLQRNVFSRLPEATVHCLMPDPDPEAEAVRYAALLGAAPIDAVCLGIGINGHIAFNDPPVADFEDPLDVKVVEMDEVCRRQQVDDEGFPDIGAVPRKALTLTVPRLMRADRLFCMVPGSQKAVAVRDALKGPISAACPASALRRHPNCTLYLDTESASHV
jgi:glucosamine-6-phosphate deaminase